MACLIAILALSLCCLTAAQTVCTPGYYDAGAAGCKKCPLGTYQPKKGKKGCIPCPDGYVSMDQGSVKCVKCDKPNQEPSQFKDSCKCIPNSVPDSGGNCSLCKPGQFMLTRRNGKRRCFSCGRKEYQPAAGQTTCIPCPDGQFANNDGTACIQCPEGEVIIDGSCGTCPPGEELDYDSCIKCEMGFFKAAKGIGPCLPCPRSSFSMTGSRNCIKCPEGQAPKKNGRCGKCPPGTYYDSYDRSCRKCFAREFQPYENIDEGCFRCSGDTNSLKGATMCTKCAIDEVLMKDGTCGVCPSGTIYGYDSMRCEKCEINTIPKRMFGETPTYCSNCPPRTYALPGATDCISCPPGQALVVAKKKGTCKACPPGTAYEVYSGKCRDCRKSYGDQYVSRGGDSTECRQCDSGSKPNKDRTECV